MKHLFFVSLAAVALGAVTGCSEFTGNPNTTTTTTTTTGATMSTTDSKGMVNTTMTDTGVAPEANPANANADVNAIPYPAIHSNGQGAGVGY